MGSREDGSKLIISSYSHKQALYIELQDDEPEDNLVEWSPRPRRCISRSEYDAQGNFLEQYRRHVEERQAMGIQFDCKHSYGGLPHFWGNPEMESPCRIVKIDGQWYLRKSCAFLGPESEWE